MSLELSEMLVAARANLWRAQERMKIFPKIWIIINDEFGFYMGGNDPTITMPQALHVAAADSGACLKCHMSPDVLRSILTRDSHWNNREVGADIMFHRKGPYMPDVHTLMSFFHV